MPTPHPQTDCISATVPEFRATGRLEYIDCDAHCRFSVGDLDGRRTIEVTRVRQCALCRDRIIAFAQETGMGLLWQC